jgi:hypothetical protein
VAVLPLTHQVGHRTQGQEVVRLPRREAVVETQTLPGLDLSRIVFNWFAKILLPDFSRTHSQPMLVDRSFPATPPVGPNRSAPRVLPI